MLREKLPCRTNDWEVELRHHFPLRKVHQRIKEQRALLAERMEGLYTGNVEMLRAFSVICSGELKGQEWSWRAGKKNRMLKTQSE